jgi:hypothetical protein
MIPDERSTSVSDREADQLLGIFNRERLRVFYTRMRIDYGVVGDSGTSSSTKAS